MKKIIFLFAMMLAVGTANADRRYATFVAPTGSGGSYNSATGVYSWTKSTDNLMTIFTLENGELANYTTLVVKNLTDGVLGNSNNWRVNLLFSDGKNKSFVWANYNDKSIKISDLDLSTDNNSTSHTLADVTAIRIGGNSGSDQSPVDCHVKILWPYVYLENENDAVVTGAIGDVAGNSGASYDGLNTTYNWTNAGSANLMAIFSGSTGDFSKYSEGVLQVSFTLDDNTNAVRIGYHYGSTFTEFGNGFYSTGTKQINLSDYSSSAASATAIRFGAKAAKNDAASGTVTIRPDQTFLVRGEAYTRSFTKDQKSTVWLPFALAADEVATIKGTFYELTNATSSNLTFTKVTSATEAYKPYVFVASETGAPFSGFKNKTIVAPKACSYTVGVATFVGSMKDTTVPNGAYGYNADNGKFSKTTSDAVTIAPFRAYIIVDGSSAPSLSVTFDDDNTTGIEDLKVVNSDVDVIYNLSGQRVDANYKGIVIKNGKKFFVR